MSKCTRILLIGGVAALVAAAPASAAQPSSGTVSLASPQIAWQGNATGYGVVPVNLALAAIPADPVCPPQACDTFTLTVADPGNLVVTAMCRCANNFTELHVHLPDGTTQTFFSDQGGFAEIAIEGAEAGTYTVDVLTNEAAFQPGAYDASAELRDPA